MSMLRLANLCSRRNAAATHANVAPLIHTPTMTRGGLRVFVRNFSAHKAGSSSSSSSGNKPSYDHIADDFRPQRPAKLVLEDGSEFAGFSFGKALSTAGETVFNTGMVGYPESLTDPSYKGQILVITYPLIGNYGVPALEYDEFGLAKNFESDKIHVSGLVVADYSHHYSHWNARRSLSKWLTEFNIPGLYGVDTRAITKKIREKGALLGKIVVEGNDVNFVDPNKKNLVAEVSLRSPKIYGKGDLKIIALDCGIKHNIIRMLAQKGATVKVVPFDYDFTNEDFDGLFISNGPGDPVMCQKTVEYVRNYLDGDKPLFGICLGNQLLSLAAGAKTYKLKYGNRGQNQPCVDVLTNQCYITPQNHGFAVDQSSLPAEWRQYFYNANDYSNEGVIHTSKPFFSVQFHPEAKGGPYDTEFLFDRFLEACKRYKATGRSFSFYHIPPTRQNLKKVLVLGSGGLSIGQAGEFDYSGSQAIKALKEENIKTVLINPNIATIQTARGLADKVYYIPVTPEFVADIIRKERPDGIMLSFGGQTALNCGVSLHESGVLQEYGVRVLGTPVKSIVDTEDREKFARILESINVTIAKSRTVETVDDAKKAALEIGYPVMIRSGFSLGGLGSGICANEQELVELSSRSLKSAPHILVEKSLKGWKEVEYEVVRDAYDNCVTVCNMENFDPMGIHTGESIVVAPSQTLTNEEYHLLRNRAIRVIKHIGIVGECNIQYALDPFSEDYAVIEVNARLSRSSALASKATGYPLAFVAAKLGMGHELPHIRNSVTKNTTACFEPSLDYIVCKVPRWDLRKFERVSPFIGSQMKSVGEVMSIGRNFQEAIQKALRQVNSANRGFEPMSMDLAAVHSELVKPTDERIFAIARAFELGMNVESIHDLTKIDRWFLHKLEDIHNTRAELKKCNLNNVSIDLMRRAKVNGFSDKQVGSYVGASEIEVRNYRKRLGVLPVVKQIDTLAAEFPAKTNYLYVTYNGCEHDVPFVKAAKPGVMVLGSGVYRIGSSVEFDYCGVMAVRTLRKLGYNTIMINYNPETVSTDYDESDRLYFEELSLERVMDIYELENPRGVVVSVGGQIPNNLALPMHKNGLNILGTTADSIDRAEDRDKFSKMLDSIGVDQPEWQALTSFKDAAEFANRVGYPVLVRPSYVLSGAAMNVVRKPEELEHLLKEAADVSQEHPVVITKFIEGAKEIEIDGVADKGTIVAHAVAEHVENAGVHSGDATLILPSITLSPSAKARAKEIGSKIAKELKISGPFNIQLLYKDDKFKVIECNLRASRSLPYVSKTYNSDFIEIATKVMVGEPYKPIDTDKIKLGHVCIKSPQFSWLRLQGADPVLGVEMASTGEVACFGTNLHDAYLKSLVSTYVKLPRHTLFINAGTEEEATRFVPYAQKLHEMGFKLTASPVTHAVFTKNHIPAKVAALPSQTQAGHENLLESIRFGRFDMVINLDNDKYSQAYQDNYQIRRHSIDFAVPLVTNVQLSHLLVDSLYSTKRFEIKSWDEYFPEDGKWQETPKVASDNLLRKRD